jgi:two-component system nitrogen regulation sensor histidine kinase NtrY
MTTTDATVGQTQNLHLPPMPETEQFVSFRQKGAGRLGAVLVFLSIVLGLSTFSILTGLTSVTPSPDVIFWLLVANGIVLSGLALLIGWQVWRLLLARHRKVPGAILHARIVGLFSLFAALPAITIAFFATITLDRGLDSWFSERTRNILETSQQVAEAYIEEQRDLVNGDVTGIALNVTQSKELFKSDRQMFLRQLATLVSLRNLSGAFIIDHKNKKIEASITANRGLGFRPPEDEQFEKASKGAPVIIGPGNGNVIRGLFKIEGFEEYYLYVYRLINPNVTSKLLKARSEKSQYDVMLAQRSGLQVTFAMMYIGVALIFLLAAVWFGMWFADRMVEPIVALVRGARKVSQGDLATKVKVAGTGDIATLGFTFNQMTEQLLSQRSELVTTNHQLDERRRFSEAVMSGVSSGVVGLDPEGVITLVNRSALKLLKKRQRDLQGRQLNKVLPEMVPFLQQAESKVSGMAGGSITLKVDQQDKNFVVQVTTERTSEDEHGVVVTFDDISELVAAQRNSAWADIARRIAHEIKNPLTPIQLAAERLKRKYEKEIKSNPEVFEKCTETIIRQVGDIRGMVDEFSSFARMPSAVLEKTDIVAVTRDALVLQKASFEEIKFETNIVDDQIEIAIDRRLVTQAITNLVKNAKESIDTRLESSPEPPPRIIVSLRQRDGNVIMTVTDNGKGLPKENRGRLTEPYVTTRVKGTGLGLAIVKRIMQDHDGKISLGDAPESFDGGIGAKINLIFPMDGKPGKAKAGTEKPGNNNKKKKNGGSK